MSDLPHPVRMRIELYRCSFCATTYLTREDAAGTLCVTDHVPDYPVREGDEMTVPMPFGTDGRIDGTARTPCRVIGIQPPHAFFQVPDSHAFNDTRIAKQLLDGLRYGAGTSCLDRYPHGWVAIFRALRKPHEVCNTHRRTVFYDAGSAIVGPERKLVGLHRVTDKRYRYDDVEFTCPRAADDVSLVADRTPN